jgi:4-hydroxy-3-methylbut-2-enyl diphosphate reductase
MNHPQEVLLAEPRGFCAGVDRAIEIVERALAKFGAPIYVRHEIVHNTYVVNDLKAKGAIFIEELSDVPPGATLIFSAHGVSKAVQEEARARGFHIFDATCPLVTKVHVEVAKLAQEGYEFIMIGHKGHPEVEGTLGQLDGGIHLVEDVADVARVQPRTDRQAGRGHADHLERGRRRRDHWPPCVRASPRCASPSSRTSATPRRTARTPSSC